MSTSRPLACRPVIDASAHAVGIATFAGEQILDVWYPDPHSLESAHLKDLEGFDEPRNVERRVIETTIPDLSAPPGGPADAYLRLHLLSHRVH